MRKVFAAESVIEASVEDVWDVLVDIERYPEWNPFTPEVKTTLEVGAPIDMHVRFAKLGGVKLWQREHVREVTPRERLVWGFDGPLGLVRAERVQTLTDLGDGRTRYRTEDAIEGPLGPIVFLFFGPSIQAGFEGVAEGLRERVGR